MKREKISIIVPIYNVEKYLERCVDSLVNQTYENIEIILVDDGSPDYCPQLCDEYAKKDSRIVVIHKKNGGLSDARNYGLCKASGEYILYVDSDDYIELDSCEKLVNGMANNVDMVVGAYKELRNNKVIEKRHSNLLQDKIYDAKEYVISAIKCDEWYAPALFEKAHRLLMRPAVSSKDNEEKKIQLMKKYVDTHIRRKVQMKDSTVYQVCCGEAYNMVHEFLKKPMASRNGNDYTKLEKSLLKAAASESKI